MDFSNKPSGVFYMERDHAYYYDRSLSSPLKIDFPEDVFVNSEVIDRKKLYTLFQEFISKSKINPNNIIHIILSPFITFEKGFDKKTVVSETEMQELLDLIPFEEIISKEFQFNKKTVIVSANKQLCNIIQNVFEDSKFIVGTIVPMSILKEIIPELGKNLNLDLILNRTDTLKTYSLYAIEEITSTVSHPKKKNSINMRYVILLGILGSLIIILSAIILLRL